MISGCLNVSRSPKTIYFYFWIHQDTQTKSIKPPGTFSKYYLYKSQNFGNPCCQFSKRRAPNNPDDPFNKTLEILDMVPISIKKHEMEFWEILGTLKPRNKKQRNRKTSKPRNQETRNESWSLMVGEE